MTTTTHHVGRIRNTDRRCVVVVPQLSDTQNALIVETDALPSRFHDPLMSIIQGEAQTTGNLYSLLQRRMMQDTGEAILTTLHKQKYLTVVAIDDIDMYPTPSNPMPLRSIVEAINAINKGEKPTADMLHKPNANNQFDTNRNVDSDEDKQNIAIGLLRQAQLMEEDAKLEADRKRSEAYRLAPHLRPTDKPVAHVDAEVVSISSVPAKKSGRPKKANVVKGK